MPQSTAIFGSEYPISRPSPPPGARYERCAFFSLQRAKRLLETIAFARGDVTLGLLLEMGEGVAVMLWPEPRAVYGLVTCYGPFFTLGVSIGQNEDKSEKCPIAMAISRRIFPFVLFTFHPSRS